MVSNAPSNPARPETSPDGAPGTPPPAAAPRPGNTNPSDDATIPRTSGSGESGPLAPSQSFGRRYHIKRLLGVGGMGAVYQAWDTELGVDVAIKVIRSSIVADPAAIADIQRRFKRELLLARLVSHRNVIRIHDLGDIDGIKYITMSFVDGTDLSTLLSDEGRLSARRTLKIARGICDGLVAAHAAGVVHRDLKPANVMVDRADDALITDFGIARLTTDRHAELASTDLDSPSSPAALGFGYAGLTRVGSVVGTIEYMPPEQARGAAITERADVYSLGLILYDLLTGRERVGSSRVDLQACKLEYSIVSPK